MPHRPRVKRHAPKHMSGIYKDAAKQISNSRPALNKSLAFCFHGDDMTSLYEIATIYRADAARLQDLDLPAEVVTDTLDAMAGELEVKAQNVVMFARDLQATAAAIKEAEEQMAKRRKAIENRAKHLLEYVQGCMETAEVQKIECSHFRLAIQAKPPSVDVYEPGLLPVEYMRTPEPPPPAPDKTAIAAAIKSGKEVPGARLVQGTRLAIS